jgi:8-oxo-dGTP diphosphatase
MTMGRPVPAAPSAGKRVGASVLFTDVDRRVLLVQPARQRSWELPGGLVMPGESPRSAAQRALEQRLTLDATIGALLVIDWIPPGSTRGDGLMLLYDGGDLDEADARGIRLPGGELNAYGFVDLEETTGLVAERLERRIAVALRSRRSGHPVELEDGRPVEGVAELLEAAR